MTPHFNIQRKQKSLAQRPLEQNNLLSNSEKLIIMELISQCHFDSKNVLKTLPEKLSFYISIAGDKLS